MAGSKILVVEDEKKISELIEVYLTKEGFDVLTAFDGKTALEVAARENPDLIVLDLMLPELSGTEVTTELRKSSSVPIIMLTARAEEIDKLLGLELGADDYMTKPFSPRELVARVRAVLRRASGSSSAPAETIVAGDVRLDLARHEAKVGIRLLELTPTEFRLLAGLMESPGRVFSRLQLVDKVQGYAFEGYERTIDAHVKNLRKKLEDDPAHPRYIQTVYGVGYKFEVPRDDD